MRYSISGTLSLVPGTLYLHPSLGETKMRYSISGTLSLVPGTLYLKLGVTNRTEAVAIAMRKQLLKI